jgi:hypothetical protein
MTTILLAILIGGAFGFVLDRVGATNPNYIIRMLNLSDLHLMKTILLAIATASFLMFGGQLVGLVDPGHMDVKSAYWGVFIGGMLLGIGFAISGFCPGTGLTAMATGRKDAGVFVIGGLVGAAAYMLSYAAVEGTGLLAGIAGGKATLGKVAGTNFPALLNISGAWIGIIVAVAIAAIAAWLPGRLRGGATVRPAE